MCSNLELQHDDALTIIQEYSSQDLQQSSMPDPDDVTEERLPGIAVQRVAEPCDGGLSSQDETSSSSSQIFSDNGYHQSPRSRTPPSLDVEAKTCVKNEDLIDGFCNTWTQKEECVITKPFDYIAALPGKNLRAQILSALNVWLQVDYQSLSVIDRVISKLHNASLLIDDIQDGSELRRGSPAAHCVFGTAQSINSANYAYFLAQQELLSLESPANTMQIFIEELLNLHRGQGIELFWRETLTVPSEDDYLLMISNKTGGLFRLATRLMQAVSTTTYNILPLAELVGLIFQIRDDHQNLCSEQMASAKGFCEDLTEGKFSLPVIHAIYNSPTDNNEILNILKLHTKNVNLKSYALWYMQTQTRSLEYTKERLSQFHDRAQAELASIGMRNELMEALLGQLKLN